jgi:Dyp-type peroxidase family
VTLDLHDIQGNVVRSYGRFGFSLARYFFFRIEDGTRGRSFLRGLIPLVTRASPWNRQTARGAPDAKPLVTTNLAFTYPGLKALGIPRSSLRTFPEDFAMGMKARRDILGDDGPSAPEHWDPIWRDPERVHVWISINAAAPEFLEERYEEIVELAEHSGGVRLLIGHRGRDPHGSHAYQEAATLLENGRPSAREHFGYVDGISDPYFAGKGGDPEDVIGNGKPTGKDPATPGGWAPLATGEFLLGHPDEACEYPRAPLPPLLSRNGTFMVYRKLHQNVASFERYIEAMGKQHGGKEWVAAKFAGRWRNGAPLTSFPSEAEANAFAEQLAAARSAGGAAYRALRRKLVAFDYTSDLEGSRCPLGAHIRRTNPRSALEFGQSGAFDTPGALSNRRRILRRGLPYGAVEQPGRDDGNHGIVFMALNADLSRQFEFVQQQWINYGNDFRLANEKDALLGNHEITGRGDGHGRMVVQGDRAQGRPPVFCRDIPRFVETRGGDYFFIPSITALEMIADGIVDVT